MRSSESYAVRVHSKPLGRHMGAFQPTRRVRLLRRTDGRFDEPGTSQKSGPEARLILGSRESSQSLAGSGFPQITMRLSCRLFKRTQARAVPGQGLIREAGPVVDIQPGRDASDEA